MGNQLDVLIGHPEHDLLFIATQVARLAGLKNPSNMASVTAKAEGGIRFGSTGLPCFGRPTVQAATWLLPESSIYKMLMRGYAPQSEPFRKWVTEEVLPSIRKTGSYDIGASKTPEAQQLSMDYGDLRALIENMAI